VEIWGVSANILFASKVLLVEGDSDVIYTYELFRQLNILDLIDVDTNVLGIMSFYDHRNLQVLLQTLKMGDSGTKIVVLTDGDPVGEALVERVKPTSAVNATTGSTTATTPPGVDSRPLCTRGAGP